MQDRVRGKLTKEATEIAREFLGRDLEDGEHKLYAYLSYISMNSGEVEFNKMHRRELNILHSLSENKHIGYTGGKVIFSKEFFIFMHEILYETHVKFRKEEFEPVWDML